MPHKELA
ncbi:uncharacterized protein FFNC_04452 [Fusarium fujikuroi]|nr:uncharacterized protein FFNC_04452 [Fusarium fujikuroi]